MKGKRLAQTSSILFVAPLFAFVLDVEPPSTQIEFEIQKEAHESISRDPEDLEKMA